MTDDSTRPMLSVVPAGRGQAGVPHSEETRALCREVYGGAGNRSPARTEKLVAPILEAMRLPIPMAQTIADWARDENWREWADELARAHPDRLRQELQRTWQAVMIVAGHTFLDMMTGLDSRDIEERVLATKQVEIAFRTVRDFPLLGRYDPPEKAIDTSELPRDEREALARQALVQRKKEGSR